MIKRIFILFKDEKILSSTSSDLSKYVRDVLRARFAYHCLWRTSLNHSPHHLHFEQ